MIFIFPIPAVAKAAALSSHLPSYNSISTNTSQIGLVVSCSNMFKHWNFYECSHKNTWKFINNAVLNFQSKSAVRERSIGQIQWGTDRTVIVLK